MSPSHAGSRQGFVLWLEGLSGAGKSTTAQALARRLVEQGWKVEVLDGDEVRKGLSPELGFSRKDRETHAHRVSYVARVLARHGVAVVVALITPYETSRASARAALGDRYSEVWLRCPLAVCQERDPKGLYKKTKAGEVQKMTGVDDPFEDPKHADLIIDTNSSQVEATVETLLAHIQARGFASGN